MSFAFDGPRRATGLRRSILLDTAAVAAATLLVFSGYLAAERSGGDPDTLALLVVGIVAAVVAARVVSAASRSFMPLLVVAGAGAVAMAFRHDLFSSWALSGPFGYANAKSAFFGLAVIGGLALGLSGKRPLVRVLGWFAAAVFAAVPVASGTIAVASLLPAAIVGLAIRKAHTVRVFVWGCALVVLGAVVATSLIAASRSGRTGNPAERFAAQSLSDRRLILWHEAWVILREKPLTGVGPGRFQHTSPTARSDRDSRWAHNEFLQTGAETGLFGLVGLLGLFAWGFGRLATAAIPTRVTAMGALALAFIGIQASVDYVLHFPAIPLLGAVLVGALIEPGSLPPRSSLRVGAPDGARATDPVAGRRSW